MISVMWIDFSDGESLFDETPERSGTPLTSQNTTMEWLSPRLSITKGYCTVRIYVPSKKYRTEEFEVNWIRAIVDFTSHVLSIEPKTESSDEPITETSGAHSRRTRM
jgi:hypothetical protein